MSIQNIVTNIGDALEVRDRNAVTVLRNVMQAAIGEARSNWASLWDGGFVGIDANNIGVLTDEVNRIITRIDEIANNFNAEQQFDGALAGEARLATQEYVEGVKDLLKAFVSTYRNFIKLAEESATAMTQGDTENAAAIRAAKDEVQQRASEIRVDA